MSLKKKEKIRITSKKAVVKKKIAAKKRTPDLKRTANKKNTGAKKTKTRKATIPVTKKASPKATPKRTIPGIVRSTDAAKSKVKRIRKKIKVETIESNLPPVEEKNNAVNNVIDQVPGTDMKSLHQKAVQNYDKHKIRLSSVKKGGPKPSGKKPLW